LGREAIRHGYSVRFTTATAVMTALLKAHSEGRLEEILVIYAKPKRLIIDEFGYLSCASGAAHCSSSWSPAATSAAASWSPATATSASEGMCVRRCGGSHRHPRSSAPPQPRSGHPRGDLPAAQEAPLRTVAPYPQRRRPRLIVAKPRTASPTRRSPFQPPLT
jgi:hypothetical protein